MSIKLDELQMILNQSVKDANLKATILKEAEELEAEKKANSGTKAKSKYKYTVVVRGDKDIADKVQQAWIIKSPEAEDDNKIPEKIQISSAQHNQSLKRKKGIIATYRDFFLLCKRKFTKANAFQPVTKEAVRVVVLESEDIKFN